jgi:hypothetical protein
MAKTHANVHCGECRYWERRSEAEGPFGQCRRRAPAPHVGVRDADQQLITEWPWTEALAWCAEGEAKQVRAR